jgi:CRISPR system Cascade subunit CasB
VSKDRIIQAYVKSRIEALDEESSWSRGALARLRRGAGKTPAETPEIWDLTLANLPEKLQAAGDEDSFAEQAIHTALTLYALHRQGQNRSMSESGAKSLGAAARGLVSPDRGNEQAIKRRFDAIITAKDLPELAHHARALVQLLRAAAPPIRLDYPRFARDLYNYQYPGSQHAMRLRWGRDFWQTGTSPAGGEN